MYNIFAINEYNFIIFLSSLTIVSFFGFAFRFIQQKLGGPSVSDYKKLQSEKSDLQIKYYEVFAKHQGTLREVSRPNLNIKVYWYTIYS